MSAVSTAALVVGGLLVLGVAAGGGPVRDSEGKMDVGATLERGADEGGKIAGRAVDDAGNAIGGGIGSAVSSSDLAKVAVAGGAAAGVIKYGPKWKPKPDTKPAPSPTPTATTQPPKRRTGWCKDLLSGTVVPCAPTKPAPSTSTTAAGNPMSPGFTAPTFRLPEATWKPCAATPGVIVVC